MNRLGVMVCGHGSRDAEAVAEFDAIANGLKERLPQYNVDSGFLEFARPIIRDGLDALRGRGVSRILAVPGMLFAAGHAKNDIPSVLNTYAAQHDDVEINYGRELGIDLKLIRAAGDRVEAALAAAGGDVDRHDTCLVVVGRGASDPDANSNVAKVCRMLWEGMGFGWAETCYSGVTFPLVEPGLEHAVRLGYRRIVVFPYFLFTGVLVKRIYSYTDKVAARHPEIEFIKAGYLNDHPLVLDTFADRVAEILDGTNVMNCQLCKYREQVLGFEAEVGLAQESHHHHVEGIGTDADKPHDHAHDHDHAHGHDHHHHHDGNGQHDHHHHPYPHADHPLGPRSMKADDAGQMPIFDAYLIVDWSANATPKRGADSIWYCLLRRTKRGLRRTVLRNPPTRAQALAELRQRLLDLVAADQRVLIGFDFPNAYPKGFARRAGFRGPPWRAVWDGVRDLIEDADDNANNRFEVAAELNRRISDAAYPFWGCPPARTGPYLSMRKTPLHRTGGDVPERRICERYVPSTQPCWKLYTTGSVGGQALVGIPVMADLRDDPALADVSQVWPFETGMVPPDPADGWRVMHTEIYPSMVKVAPGPDEVKDALQVESIGRRFAEIDAADALGPQFAGPAELSKTERRLIEREEGWILGAGTLDAPTQDDYVRDPQVIYAQSFATIRRETALDDLPRDIADVAVRLIHACGMTDLAADLAFSPDVARAARRALRAGAPVLCDTEMTAHGVIRRALPADNRVLCTLRHKRVPALAARNGTTRSAAAVDLWRRHLDGAVVSIGNAPTALFRLLELLRDGAPKPAAVFGLPVGFVGAAESKQALIDAELGVPYLTLRGRRGGSAMAAAAVNAIAGAAT